MIRGKENLIEWVKSTPNVKQIQIRTSPGADAFQFQSEEGENKKTMEDRLSRTLDYLEPGKYYIEMSDGNSRRNCGGRNGKHFRQFRLPDRHSGEY